MVTAQQLHDFVQLFGPVSGLLLIFVAGLKMEWWYMGPSVKEIVKGKDDIILLLTKEIEREREIAKIAVQQVRETVDWVKAGERAGR